MMNTTWVLPLLVEEVRFNFRGKPVDDWPIYRVVTRGGSPVGPRLLKGIEAPYITDWGPFNSHEDAVRLKATLSAHIENWPKRRKRYG